VSNCPHCGTWTREQQYIFIYSYVLNIYILSRCISHMLTSREDRQPPCGWAVGEAEFCSVTTSKPGAISNNSIYWVLKLLWIPSLNAKMQPETTPLCLPSAMSLSQRSTGLSPGLLTRNNDYWLVQLNDAWWNCAISLHSGYMSWLSKKAQIGGTSPTYGTENSKKPLRHFHEKHIAVHSTTLQPLKEVFPVKSKQL